MATSDGNQQPLWTFAPVIKGQQWILIAFKEEGSALADVMMANKLTAPQISSLGRKFLYLADIAFDHGSEDRPMLVSDVWLPRNLEVDPERCEQLPSIERTRPCILVRWEKIHSVRVDLSEYGKLYAGQLWTMGGHFVAQSDFVYRQAFPTAEGKESPKRILTPIVKAGPGLIKIPGGRNH